MHYFSTIGSSVHNRDADADIKPFQRLIFLVRDWGFEDPGPGEQGGRRYINEYMDDTGAASKRRQPVTASFSFPFFLSSFSFPFFPRLVAVSHRSRLFFTTRPKHPRAAPECPPLS